MSAAYPYPGFGEQVAEKQERLKGMQADIELLTYSSKSRVDLLAQVQVGRASTHRWQVDCAQAVASTDLTSAMQTAE